ncbi:MAG: response regulator transcription factor [Chloroflexi bacterium]|nr:response regulator transcription factor [Chloroflexota bacterium]
MLRILIADDHDLARAGLRGLLASEPTIAIVGEALDGRHALALCAECQPDLVLLDVRMPQMDGLAATRAIKAAYPQVRVLIVTLHASLEYLVEAIKAGAAGYVLKEASRAELIEAINQVNRGDTFLNQGLMVQALQRLANEPPGARAMPGVALTPRERDVLRLLVEGRTNRQIGQHLAISPGTVKIHVEHIIAKLGVSDRTQAAVRAIELRLL